jgi:hypothetical protein
MELAAIIPLRTVSVYYSGGIQKYFELRIGYARGGA